MAMKIVYLGSGEFGIESLNAVLDSPHSLELVVTASPQPSGRGRKLAPTAVAAWAKEQSIPCLETDNVNTQDVFEKIASFKPDLILVIAFGQKIGTQLVGLPAKGTINVHGSLLPKYRGAGPINRAIINGERQSGISIINVAEKMDAGEIYSYGKTDIAPDETAGQLHDKLAKLSAPVLIETLEKIAKGSITPVQQDDAEATLAPKLKKSDGFIDFEEGAEVLQNKIRGFWPWPGATCFYVSKKSGKSLRVSFAATKVVKTAGKSQLEVGSVDGNLNIVCGKDALEIVRIKPAGSSVMKFKDFVNGHRVSVGDLFTRIEK